MYSYEVITKVPPPGDSGNLAVAFDLHVVKKERSHANDFTETVQPIHEVIGVTAMLGLRKPVFQVGEVLIVDGGGREVAYPGRKTSKWSGVESEVFDDVESAVARASEVLSKSLKADR